MAKYLGPDGNNAPERRDGYLWITWIGVRGRLFTRRGEQLLRLDYGINLESFVDRLNSRYQVQHATRRALSGLTGINDIDVQFDGVNVSTEIIARVRW